ncbi:MAG: hypothetical protein E2O62_05270 [Gammaproteobacteria bacterium]|nr:MAG: hypothetical protein E2O62_05270 [Gammaproteobacteria bacterium]
MKKRLTKFALFLSILIPVCVIAGREDKVDPKLKPEYLSQDQVTREDYNTMSEFGISYDECLADTSRAEVANYNDPRHVVDVAMKKCAVKLEELNDWLTEKRFPPNFKKGHIRKLSGKSVRKVMPQVMFLMSTKQQ